MTAPALAQEYFILPLVFALSLALSPTISTLPLIILLSVLLNYVNHILKTPRQSALLQFGLLWATLSLGVTSAHILPSIHALSSSAASIAVLALLSAFTSFITLSTVVLNDRLSTRIHSWPQITLFPTIWALTWFTVTQVSFVGRLLTWSSTSGLPAYNWIAPFAGPVGFDWITAAWAVVIARVLKPCFLIRKEEDLIDLHQPADNVKHTVPCGVLTLFAILTALSIPSLFITDLPLRPYSSGTTPFGVGCVLPIPHSNHAPSLDDFIAESRKLSSMADILLWPEGAVLFDNSDARQAGLEKIGDALPGHLVGVSFEELDDRDNNERRRRRTGLALIHRDGTPNASTEVKMLYYKRHLVPIAESFSLAHSEDPPSIYTLDLRKPADMNKTDWAPPPGYTRPIPITASICLDFAWPSAFSRLETRPSLILAPARTWHTAVGFAMWEHAKARAAEIGSMILWCDGGHGGVSGIAGGGIHEVTHVGQGSWARKIGLPYPLDENRTVYARGGDSAVLVFFLLLSAGGLAWVSLRTGVATGHPYAHLAIPFVRGKIEAVKEWWRSRNNQDRPLLVLD